ncbi:dolichyl-phosphate-mannose-protein mannosyltransferase, partial [Tubulinosema ratisbonensis]
MFYLQNMISEQNIHISLIFITSLIVRSYNLSKEYYVKWDEKHFLNFARMYLLKKFHFDVHPPLGKLILAF